MRSLGHTVQYAGAIAPYGYFTLPVELDDAGAAERMEHGMLLLRLPKKQAAQPRQIQIQ